MTVTKEQSFLIENALIKDRTEDSIVKSLENGVIFDADLTMYPSKLIGYVGLSSSNEKSRSYGSVVSTCYGLVLEGNPLLKQGSSSVFTIPSNHYFSITGNFELSGTGKVAIIERVGYRGTFTLGGPLEPSGRLCYIDGCSDTLLIAPHRLGDPCLNLLTFPKNTKQTFHIHPSVRLGVVVWGEGLCLTDTGSIPLTKGKVFYLPERLKHCFHTSDQELAVVAYHPDSDWGPTDEKHPMINRTYINNVAS